MLQYAFRILLRFYELYNLVEALLYCWLILKIIIIITGIFLIEFCFALGLNISQPIRYFNGL
jgi:hypothetical protein